MYCQFVGLKDELCRMLEPNAIKIRGFKLIFHKKYQLIDNHC